VKHRWVTAVILFAGITVVLNQLFERVFHFSLLDPVRNALTTPGPSAAAAILALLAVDVFLPVPSSIVMILSGALFGTIAGGAISLLGSLIGNVAGYETMRRFGPAVCARFVKREDLDRMLPVFERYGAVAIILSRPLPVVMETLSLVAGLFRMPRGKFVVSSIVGTLPICFLYAYAGASALASRTVVPALFVFVCVPAVAWLIVQRLRRK
jgi:uncharacterized membrane protein YdjX (TVP38/TMEM64 family)